MNKQVYLDHAAASPLDRQVKQAMDVYDRDKFYNPSAIYLSAKSVKDDIAQARSTVAGLIGSKPSEVIFTAGGTEANNIAIKGVMNAYSGSSMVISSIEHDSVLKTALKYNHKQLKVDNLGIVSTTDLAKTIDDQTVLVSIIYASNEIGSVQPLARISKILAEIRSQRQKTGNPLPIYLHSDASQAPNYLDIHIHRLGVDLMTLNGGKIYGPKQSGILMVRTGVKLEPFIFGGGQERGIRSGTENPGAIIGFCKALGIAQKTRKSESDRLADLNRYFVEKLKAIDKDIFINGSIRRRLPNNIHLTVAGTDNERLVMELDEQGIMCSAGSACSASSDQPSHVLQAIGLSKQNIQSSLRFTMGRSTTKSDIDYVVLKLQKIIARTL
jgi:cysteine desulfurase